MEPIPTPEQLVADLVLLLDMEPRGADRFHGRCRKGGTERVFGGQAIAQALAAAERTVSEDRAAHSLHCYFLRGGNALEPIDYTVMRDFDGGSFSNRRVTACQNGEVILNLTASFQRMAVHDFFHHQDHQKPDVPPPESLTPDYVARRSHSDAKESVQKPIHLQRGPIDYRTVGLDDWLEPGKSSPRSHIWFRTTASLPDDPRVHRAVLAYASDTKLLGTASLPHRVVWGSPDLDPASLDHAIWFHDDFRADDWLLYVIDSPWAGNHRGYSRGQIYSRDGRLIASVAQEGMIRFHKDR